MFRSIPTAIIEATRLDPPKLTKGRGRPFAGMQAVTTAILIVPCSTTEVARPKDRNNPRSSAASRQIFIEYQRKARNSPVITRQPRCPVSSPIMAKTKSEYAEGR